MPVSSATTCTPTGTQVRTRDRCAGACCPGRYFVHHETMGKWQLADGVFKARSSCPLPDPRSIHAGGIAARQTGSVSQHHAKDTIAFTWGGGRRWRHSRPRSVWKGRGAAWHNAAHGGLTRPHTLPDARSSIRGMGALPMLPPSRKRAYSSAYAWKLSGMCSCAHSLSEQPHAARHPHLVNPPPPP